jgi:putative solute:sodium symporter small subunit
VPTVTGWPRTVAGVVWAPSGGVSEPFAAGVAPLVPFALAALGPHVFGPGEPGGRPEVERAGGRPHVEARESRVSESRETGEPDTGWRQEYWKRNLRLMVTLLVIWFTVSFGFGILLVEPLNEIVIGGFPLGFWFAQQGSIYVFLLLILVYALRMDRLDAEFGVDERDDEGNRL